LANGGALTTLDLGHNDIGRAGAEALAKALMANDVLTSLLLRGNWLRDAGARALSRAFGALTSLDLGSNAINDAGAIALIEAHKANGVLTSLLLKGNSVTYSRTHSVGVDFETELAEAFKAPSLEERRSKCDLILDKLKATADERIAAENAAAEKAAADRAAKEQAVLQKAYTAGYTKGFNDARAGREFAPIADGDALEPALRLEKDEV